MCQLGEGRGPVEIKGSCVALAPSGGEQDPTPHRIMVVVKAPDQKDYDLIGNGRNIDKLKDLLALATIDTREVYVTGLVKCAPPKRAPGVTEIKACMPHLGDELRAVNPDVVVLMGTDSLRAFNLMGEGGVNSLQGQVIKKAFPHDDTLTKEWNVVVTSDPNALFMNPDPKLESKIVKSFRTAKSVVKGWDIAEDPPDTDYKLIDSLEDLDWMIEKIKAKGVFAFDTESRSLPWSAEPMICAQFCWGYDTGDITSAVLPIYNHDPTIKSKKDWRLKPRWSNEERKKVVLKLKEIFEDSRIPKIAHNIKYDMCVIQKHLGIETNGFLFDTMLMHHLLWEHPPHDLEYLADLELDTGDYSKDLHDITGRGKVLKDTYDAVPDYMMWLYGSKDVENTFRLMTVYFPRLKAQANLWKLYQEEVHPFIRTLFKAERYGVRLDSDVIDALTEEFTKEKEVLLVKIKAETWPDFNPNSSADVAKCITNAGYFKDIKDERKQKGYSTNKARLLKLASKFPLVEDIMRHRTLVKLTGTYMSNAKEYSKGDGRARIGVMIHGTVNGRAATPFLHQIPRLDMARVRSGKGNLRDMFVCNPGYKIVYGDYSQIELVTMAIEAEDEEMLAVFSAGVDIHKATAAAFLECELDEVEDFNRSIGKQVNFGRVYGSTDGYALMKLTWLGKDGKEHPITEAMVRRGFASLDARFPAAARYFTDTVNVITANNGIHTTPFGRMKRMGTMMNAPNEYARAEAERQAVNGTIQSSASSVTVRCLNNVDAFLEGEVQAGKMSRSDAFLVLTVHDSGAWEVRDEHVGWFVPKLQEIATLPVPELNDYQFTMNVGVGNSWTEAELNAEKE